ncbi:hypothetical protein QDY65_07840 [Pyrococcus kukulkanii]|uniref:hypothetical protein n=1 Tax=Pyrococcus kukulkanii TaxID=1609559 RepID=UPI003569C32D
MEEWDPFKKKKSLKLPFENDIFDKPRLDIPLIADKLKPSEVFEPIVRFDNGWEVYRGIHTEKYIIRSSSGGFVVRQVGDKHIVTGRIGTVDINVEVKIGTYWNVEGEVVEILEKVFRKLGSKWLES